MSPRDGNDSIHVLILSFCSNAAQALGFIDEPDSDEETIGGRAQFPITCDLDASIQCETMDGAECSFSPISRNDMMCQEAPTKLMWLYKGPNLSSTTSVNVRIHGEESDEIYFEGHVSSPRTGYLDSVVELDREFTIPMETIYVYIGNDSALKIPNLCHPKKGAVIGETFGVLQFAGYETKTKSVRGFRHLEWSFAARSEAGHGLTVKKATVVFGEQTKTIEAGLSLGPHEEVSFTSRQTISLPVGGSAIYSGAVTVLAVGTDKEECAAAAASYINV